MTPTASPTRRGMTHLPPHLLSSSVQKREPHRALPHPGAHGRSLPHSLFPLQFASQKVLGGSRFVGRFAGVSFRGAENKGRLVNRFSIHSQRFVKDLPELAFDMRKKRKIDEYLLFFLLNSRRKEQSRLLAIWGLAFDVNLSVNVFFFIYLLSGSLLLSSLSLRSRLIFPQSFSAH